MIIIDYSSTAIAAITGTFRDDLNKSEEEIGNLVIHVIISTIKSLKKKFRAEYGEEVVLAIDSSHYWRKDIFPHYKASRKKQKEDSLINWGAVHKYMEQTKNILKENFPYKVIETYGAEADDVIAVLSTLCVDRIVTDGLFEDSERCLIVGTDKDYKQQLRFKNIRLYNPREKKYVALDMTANEFLKRQILTGDKSDGIPGVFSPSDSFVNGIRQKPCTEKKMLPLLQSKNMILATEDEIVKKRIFENYRLIDFRAIPDTIKSTIISDYEKCVVGNKMKIYKWLIANNMQLMLRDLEDF